jgi:hypothetical protein
VRQLVPADGGLAEDRSFGASDFEQVISVCRLKSWGQVISVCRLKSWGSVNSSPGVNDPLQLVDHGGGVSRRVASAMAVAASRVAGSGW